MGRKKAGGNIKNDLISEVDNLCYFQPIILRMQNVYLDLYLKHLKQMSIFFICVRIGVWCLIDSENILIY